MLGPLTTDGSQGHVCRDVADAAKCQYKVCCRYHRAVQGLREESRLLSASQMTLTPQYDQRRGIVTDLLHLLVTSEEPAH